MQPGAEMLQMGFLVEVGSVVCGAKPPLGDLKVYSHRKYKKILRLLLVTSGAPDRLATCTCTIARVESSRWVLYQDFREGGYPRASHKKPCNT